MRGRTLLAGGGLLALGACGAVVACPQPEPGPAPPVPAPRRITLASGLDLHVVQTGWVAVKRPHRDHRGPAALGLPAILASTAWTAWMPIRAHVLEHPDGPVVIDTGETARMATDPDWPACDPVNGRFYGRHLRVALAEDDEIGPQMGRLGLDPAMVRRVALTHLHSDHVGGLGWFPQARVRVSAGDAGGHPGALLCRMPMERVEAVAHERGPVGAFAAHHPLTADGAALLVPTPGHTGGHQSVLVRDGDRSWLLAGDAAFDMGQVRDPRRAGIAADPRAATATLEVLAR